MPTMTTTTTAVVDPGAGRYPVGDPAAREAIRDRLYRQHMTAARAVAARAGRSPKCAGILTQEGEPQPRPWHTDQPGGCRNTGTGCLCPCHDRTQP
jgi:hypothetical protein